MIGRYRLGELLAQGGTSKVYRAWDEHGAAVALKQLVVRGAAAKRQFQVGAEILGGLSHAGLPRVRDYFEADGGCCIVMDLIEGQTLSDAVAARHPVPPSQVRAWLLGVGDVLIYLHKNGIVFRDLQPSNIMVSGDAVKLIDFGVSKILDPATGRGTGTFARRSLTPGFASPEQYVGASDEKSDLYSLGATFYFVVTGEPPPTALELMSGMCSLAPTDAGALGRAVERMLTPDRARRPASVEEALSAVRASP